MEKAVTKPVQTAMQVHLVAIDTMATVFLDVKMEGILLVVVICFSMFCMFLFWFCFVLNFCGFYSNLDIFVRKKRVKQTLNLCSNTVS